MTTETLTQQTSKKPKWLKRFQENIWEAEILISGGAIFSLFELSDFLADSKHFFSDNFPVNGLDEMIIISMICCKGVTFSFILHLFLRAIWIATVCVQHAFPRGINLNNPKMTALYQDKNDVTLVHSIDKLHRACGLVFYSGFAFVLMVTGIVFSALLITLASSLHPIVGYFSLLLAAIFYIDLFTSGLLRRSMLARLYYPVYYFFNSITLLFIYRKSLQIIFSNVRKLPVFAFMVVLTIVVLCLSYLSLYRVLNLPEPFDSREIPATTDDSLVSANVLYLSSVKETDPIRYYAIESDRVSGPYLKIFVNYKAGFGEGVMASGKKAFGEIVSVTVDGQQVKGLHWVRSNRTFAKQKGIITMIPIEHLEKGLHSVHVDIPHDLYRSKEISKVDIAFWKE